MSDFVYIVGKWNIQNKKGYYWLDISFWERKHPIFDYVEDKEASDRRSLSDIPCLLLQSADARIIPYSEEFNRN